MKKMLSLLLPLILSLFLCGCHQGESVNLLHFTDNLNRIREKEKISLSDYLVDGKAYRLMINAEAPLLLTLEEDEGGKIKKIRLTIGKTDKKGNTVRVSDSDAAYFTRTACEILGAFTFYEKEECESLVKALLPPTGDGFMKTGEATTDKENFHLVCYSNKLCLQFFAVNTYLEETESTTKP